MTTYDLSRIQSTQTRRGFALQCHWCGAWRRELLTLDGYSWQCRKCARQGHGRG